MSDSEHFSVGALTHFSKISSMPLCKACPGCGGMVHIRKVSCSCGHVFISKCSKPHLTATSGSRKHTMSSFRAIETDEKAADRRSVNRACKAKKRVLETEEEAFERITCSIPEDDSKLKDLVLLLQQHRQSSYCKRKNVCRFAFPHPPSFNTLIAETCKDPTLSSSSQDVLTKVRKALVEGCNDLTIDELLERANVDPDQYMSAFAMSYQRKCCCTQT